MFSNFGGRLAALPTIRPPTQKSAATPVDAGYSTGIRDTWTAPGSARYHRLLWPDVCCVWLGRISAVVLSSEVCRSVLGEIPHRMHRKPDTVVLAGVPSWSALWVGCRRYLAISHFPCGMHWKTGAAARLGTYCCVAASCAEILCSPW